MKKTLRILHIVGSLILPPNPDVAGVSGAVRAALEIGRVQVQLGHQVWVAAVGQEAWQVDWHGVHLINIKLMPWARVQFCGRSLDFSVQLPLALLTRRYRFDVIQGYMHNYLRFLRGRLRAAYFQTDPLYHGHGTDDISMKTADFNAVARFSHVQFAVSRFVAEQLKHGFGENSNVSVIYNGVDSQIFNCERWQERRNQLRQTWGVVEGDVVILYAGAIVPEKGVLPLARAFARLSTLHPNVYLVLAGGASLWNQSLVQYNPKLNYEYEVLAALKSASLNGRVHVLGPVSSGEMPGLYAASDVVVVPSTWQEPFGLVAVEALASSRPVIASNTGGLPETLDEGCGLLVPPGDEAGLETALGTLAESSPLRQQMGTAGRMRALNFSWERTVQSIDAVYAVNL